MAISEMTRDDFEGMLKGAGNPMLLYFYAPWCGVCRSMEPTLYEVSDEIEIGKINVDENPEIASRMGVTSLPATVVYRDGKPSSPHAGSRSADQLRELLQG